jgi:hypothetical protein
MSCIPDVPGLDVSKRDAKVRVRIQDPGRARAASAVTTWGATTPRILALRDHLVDEGVTLVVMEATSDYWKPFYYVFEDGPFEVEVPPHRLTPGTHQGPCGHRARHAHRYWNMLNTGAFYTDPGADFYTQRNPVKAKNRAIDQLRGLGYVVSLEPLLAAG